VATFPAAVPPMTHRFAEEPVMRKDHALQRAVLEHLDFDPAINSSHIGVSVHEGVVTLNGHVPSIGDKARAETAAGLVGGVKAVVDELTVELGDRPYTPDETLARRAFERLASNSKVPPDRIHLSVDDGIIILRGDVDWDFQRAAAVSDINQMHGVRGVRNEVTIRPPIQAELVSSRIRDALERMGLSTAGGIEIAVTGSEIALCGVATSWREKQLAESVAWSLPGVSSVRNHLTIC
jgi:osmotically-inducible protein OsmY